MKTSMRQVYEPHLQTKQFAFLTSFILLLLCPILQLSSDVVVSVNAFSLDHSRMKRRVDKYPNTNINDTSKKVSMVLRSRSSNDLGGSVPPLPSIRAAVIVPGFLTGKQEFDPLAASLTAKGIPTVVVPMGNWHWLPCLGGRSMRPMLERIDFTVRHLAAVAGSLGDFAKVTTESLEASIENVFELSGEPKWERAKNGASDLIVPRRNGAMKGSNENGEVSSATSTRTVANERDVSNLSGISNPQLLIPDFSYNLIDCWQDFRNNPGGVMEVGGSAEVDKYPLWNPKGSFPEAPDPMGRVALIGHSAGGWICRAYLSGRNYGGKSYNGYKLVHSLITLGTPHGNAPGPAFKGVEWVNRENVLPNGVRALAVGGKGYRGDSSGEMTKNSYAFCCPNGTDGSHYDGDGVTPVESALAMKTYLPDADTLVLDDVGHFCWSEVAGADTLAPDLTQFHRDGRPWYGDNDIIEKWAEWL